MAHGGGKMKRRHRFGANVAVESQPGRIAVSGNVGFAQVGHMRLGFRVNQFHQANEVVDRQEMFRAWRHEVLGKG